MNFNLNNIRRPHFYYFDYADDVAIFAPSACVLQEALTILQEEADLVGMQISWPKTKLMAITPNPTNHLSVKICNKEVVFVDSFTYLGSFITNDGSSRRSPPPRRVRHALSKAPPGCVLAAAHQQPKASVNAPSNQNHHPSYGNAACAGPDISTACHPPSLYEESLTSIQTSMVGKDQEAGPKPDGLVQSNTTSILLASTPSMLPRWSMTDLNGRPLFADWQRSNSTMAL